MMPARSTMKKGGVRRYANETDPAEYVPDIGEVNLGELTLTGLADLYGSDKGSCKHRYTDVYEALIDELLAGRSRHLTRLKIIEFGVACGASLRMWCNYLPEAEVVGYDIRPECASLCGDLPNCTIRIEDARHASRPFTANLIVDDASHLADQMVDTFMHCWPWVAPGGIYVIEDTHCSYRPTYTEEFNHLFKTEAKNDRKAFTEFVDRLMIQVDEMTDIASFEYRPRMLIVRRRHTGA